MWICAHRCNALGWQQAAIQAAELDAHHQPPSSHVNDRRVTLGELQHACGQVCVGKYEDKYVWESMDRVVYPGNCNNKKIGMKTRPLRLPAHAVLS